MTGVEEKTEKDILSLARRKFLGKLILKQKRAFGVEGDEAESEYVLIAVEANQYFSSKQSWDDIAQKLSKF